jgi:hypothetical protein
MTGGESPQALGWERVASTVQNPDNAQKPGDVPPAFFVFAPVGAASAAIFSHTGHESKSSRLKPLPQKTGVNAMGQSVVVLGAQWGDECKGKNVDLLT